MTCRLCGQDNRIGRRFCARCGARATWPAYAAALTSAATVVVPALVLAEVDYFLRAERAAMRKLIAEVFDPATTYEFEPAAPRDIVRGLEFDAKFRELSIGLVDGMVAAVAKRRRILRALTRDRRDFGRCYAVRCWGWEAAVQAASGEASRPVKDCAIRACCIQYSIRRR